MSYQKKNKQIIVDINGNYNFDKTVSIEDLRSDYKQNESFCNPLIRPYQGLILWA